MAHFLQLFILIPLLGFISSLWIPRKKETFIFWIAILTIGIHMIGFVIFSVFWLINSHPILDIKHIVLFKTSDIEIFIDFYFDKITAVFCLVGSFLTFIVTIFSRYYLHREEGFRRFFNTILFFYLGYNIVIFSGNFETLFIGWEILGICSFLLIAFYRDRYLPVKNALKTIFVYRFSDICLILAMWMSHHLWHENITFLKLNNLELVQMHIHENYFFGIFISIMLLIAASAKSAQLPFSSWLPRAMEGPTTSSAIFYGSLSVHLGVFLLLRTFPYWENLSIIKGLVICIGLSTSFISTGIARVQSSVKTQIAYSSMAQIGIIFIELALGFHNLALIHFAGNAFLRTYQLLVSPSVLSYLIHDQFYNFTPRTHKEKDSLYRKIKYTLYILCIKEWNLDNLLYHQLWYPFTWLGNKLNFLKSKVFVLILITTYLLGLYCYFFQKEIPGNLFEFLPFLFSFIGLMLILKTFTEIGDAVRVWLLVISGQLFTTLAIALFNENFGHKQIFIYLSGSLLSAIIGYFCLKKIKSLDNDIDLNHYHGYIYEQPKLALVFLLSCLGLAGFPITPTFIGIDLMFSHIHKQEVVLILFISLSFLFIELSVLRIYARIFMGQHKKTYHPIAFKSS